MIGHFPAGVEVRESLIRSRSRGLDFGPAWQIALHDAHLKPNGVPLSGRREEIAEALTFARPAFRRAYEGQPRTRQDVVAGNLLKVMEHLLDDSSDAGTRHSEVLDLMQAA